MIDGLVSAKQINDIAKAVMQQDYDYDYIGLRIQESDYGLTIGQEINHRSRIWDDGDMTGDELDGVCAVDVRAAAKRTLSFGYYSGNVVLVLGSNRRESGEDDGEIILKSSYGQNPVVLDIIRI